MRRHSQPRPAARDIICYICNKPGHKAPDCTYKNQAVKAVYADPAAAAWWDVIDEDEDLHLQDDIFEPIFEEYEYEDEEEDALEDLADTLLDAEQQLEFYEDAEPSVLMNHT